MLVVLRSAPRLCGVRPEGDARVLVSGVAPWGLFIGPGRWRDPLQTSVPKVLRSDRRGGHPVGLTPLREAADGAVS